MDIQQIKTSHILAINSTINCRAYSSFVSAQSDHCIESAKVRLSLHASDSKSNVRVPCYWSSLKKLKSNTIFPTLRNTFTALLEDNHTNLPKDTSIKFQKGFEEAALVVYLPTIVLTRKSSCAFLSNSYFLNNRE